MNVDGGKGGRRKNQNKHVERRRDGEGNMAEVGKASRIILSADSFSLYKE